MNKKISPEKIRLLEEVFNKVLCYEEPHWCARREMGVIIKQMFDLLVVHKQHKKFMGTYDQYEDLKYHLGSAYSITRIACARFHKNECCLKGVQNGVEVEREALDIPGVPLPLPVGTLIDGHGKATAPVNRNMNDHSEPSTSQ